MDLESSASRPSYHDLDTDPITARVIGAAIDLHRHLGPGLLERTYETFLEVGIRKRGLRVRRQVELPAEYLGVRVACSYRVDLLVEDTVVVEVKAVRALAPIHVSQVLTYLRIAELRVGLLFNFNVDVLARGGFKRVLRDVG